MPHNFCTNSEWRTLGKDIVLIYYITWSRLVYLLITINLYQQPMLSYLYIWHTQLMYHVHTVISSQLRTHVLKASWLEVQPNRVNWLNDYRELKLGFYNLTPVMGEAMDLDISFELRLYLVFRIKETHEG